MSVFSQICLPVVSLANCPIAPVPSDPVKGLLLHTCPALSRVYLPPPSPVCPPLLSLRSTPLSFSLSLPLSFCVSGFLTLQAFRGRDTHPGHHRHVRLWDPCCSCWGPGSCCLHQHQGWPGQMVGNLARNEWVVNACYSPFVEGLSLWPLTQDTSKMIFQSPFQFTTKDHVLVLKTCPVTPVSCEKT